MRPTLTEDVLGLERFELAQMGRELLDGVDPFFGASAVRRAPRRLEADAQPPLAQDFQRPARQGRLEAEDFVPPAWLPRDQVTGRGRARLLGRIGRTP